VAYAEKTYRLQLREQPRHWCSASMLLRLTEFPFSFGYVRTARIETVTSLDRSNFKRESIANLAGRCGGRKLMTVAQHP
jgi:hypothetical protein